MPRFQAKSASILVGFAGAGGDAAHARTSGEEAGGFAVDQFHVVGFSDIDFVKAFELEQFAFDHHLGE